jgi:hypothetical protein
MTDLNLSVASQRDGLCGDGDSSRSKKVGGDKTYTQRKSIGHAIMHKLILIMFGLVPTLFRSCRTPTKPTPHPRGPKKGVARFLRASSTQSELGAISCESVSKKSHH